MKVKMVRKGMGSGQGKGYKNMIGVDSRVHSMSSKGIKQPQRINPFISKNKYPKYNSVFVKLENGKFIPLSNIIIISQGDTNKSVERLADGSIRLFNNLKKEVGFIDKNNFVEPKDYDKLYSELYTKSKFLKEIKKPLHKSVIEVMIDINK